MTNVVNLNITGYEVNAAAVDVVERLLHRLSTGESVAVAFVEVGRGGMVSTAYQNSAAGEYHRLNSGAARLALRLAGEPDDA